MLTLGCHLSISKGYVSIVQDALSIRANTFAFFTRNPRGGGIREVSLNEMSECRRLLSENGFGPLVAHAPYTLNPCAAKDGLREYAIATMIEDLHRLSALPGNYYNFHPGSHVGQGTEKGIELTADFLDHVLPASGPTTVLIETMAGKGSEIGRTFEEISAIIQAVKTDTSNLGVCLDTCHIWDGGYDIANQLDETIHAFDQIIGLKRLKAIHLNDSMNPLSAHKDRHAKIGEGHIGFATLLNVVKHPALCELPFILETPNEMPGYAHEIEMFRKAV